MKITKRPLKRIIKEERTKLLKEFEKERFRDTETNENLFLVINTAIEKLLDNGFDTLELANELHAIADDVEASGPLNYHEDR